MLVSNLDIIWRAMSNGKHINPIQFEKLCEKTLHQYMIDAGWYSLSPTLHRVLVHGRDIIEATPIAIGATSEEGSEANAKFARRFLQHHTRKTSHKDTMFDLFHRLMDISDPIVVAQSFVATEKQTKDIPADLALLICDNQENIQSEPNLSIFDISLSEQSMVEE